MRLHKLSAKILMVLGLAITSTLSLVSQGRSENIDKTTQASSFPLNATQDNDRSILSPSPSSTSDDIWKWLTGDDEERPASRGENYCLIAPSNKGGLNRTTNGFPIFVWDGDIKEILITSDNLLEPIKIEDREILGREFWIYNQDSPLPDGWYTYEVKTLDPENQPRPFNFQVISTQSRNPSFNQANLRITTQELQAEIIKELDEKQQPLWDRYKIFFATLDGDAIQTQLAELQKIFCDDD